MACLEPQEALEPRVSLASGSQDPKDPQDSPEVKVFQAPRETPVSLAPPVHLAEQVLMVVQELKVMLVSQVVLELVGPQDPPPLALLGPQDHPEPQASWDPQDSQVPTEQRETQVLLA